MFLRLFKLALVPVIKKWLVPSNSHTINMWKFETQHLQLTAGLWIMVCPEQLWIKNWLFWTEKKCSCVPPHVCSPVKLKNRGNKKKLFLTLRNNRWSLQHRCVWQGGRRRSWGEQCGAHARKRLNTQAASVHALWMCLRDLRGAAALERRHKQMLECVSDINEGGHMPLTCHPFSTVTCKGWVHWTCVVSCLYICIKQKTNV